MINAGAHTVGAIVGTIEGAIRNLKITGPSPRGAPSPHSGEETSGHGDRISLSPVVGMVSMSKLPPSSTLELVPGGVARAARPQGELEDIRKTASISHQPPAATQQSLEASGKTPMEKLDEKALDRRGSKEAAAKSRAEPDLADPRNRPGLAVLKAAKEPVADLTSLQSASVPAGRANEGIPLTAANVGEWMTVGGDQKPKNVLH